MYPTLDQAKQFPKSVKIRKKNNTNENRVPTNIVEPLIQKQ